MTIAYDRLHRCNKRDVCPSVRGILCQAEELSDSHLNRVTLSDALFEFLQIPAHAIPFDVMFVNRAPAVADKPPIHSVRILLALIYADITPHPLHMAVGAGRIALKDPDVRFPYVLTTVDVTMMVAHQLCESLSLTNICLLEIERFLIGVGGHVKPQVCSSASSCEQRGQVTLGDDQIRPLLKG